MINSNIYGQEFLGRNIQITASTNKSLENVSGTIVKETKNTFCVETATKKITVPKSPCTFSIQMERGEFTLYGKFICIRPENRLKELNKIKKSLKRME